jgi:hypothetical protein
VDAYTENILKVRLFEGKVVVSSGKKDLTLLPGEELILDKRDKSAGKRLTIERIRSGFRGKYFEFDELDIRTVLLELGKAYGYTVDFRGQFDENKSWSGIFYRTASIHRTLEHIAKATNLHIEINGRTITVRSR